MSNCYLIVFKKLNTLIENNNLIINFNILKPLGRLPQTKGEPNLYLIKLLLADWSLLLIPLKVLVTRSAKS